MAVGSLLLSLSSLPTSSSSSSSSLSAGTRRTKRHYGNDNHNIQKSNPHSPHDDLQWRSRRGLLSPLLSNRPNDDKLVECNPDEEEITEANVGVLRCTNNGISDQVCRASVDSSLGGFCYTSSSSSSSFMESRRNLQFERTNYIVCDPSSPYFEKDDCDCSNFDLTTKSGSISCRRPTQCLGSQFYGCYETCMTSTGTNSFVNGTFGDYEQCNEITAGDGTTSTSFCLQLPADSSSCQVELEGQLCTSCTLSPEVGVVEDCSNVLGVDGEEPEGPNDGFLASLPIIQACYQPQNSTASTTGEYCNLCVSGGFIDATDTTMISLQGFGEAFPCPELQLAAWNFQISDDKCPEAAALAQAKCCSLPPSMAPGKEEGSSTGTASPISSTTLPPGTGPDPPTAAPNSSAASVIVPLCSAMMMLLIGVLLQ